MPTEANGLRTAVRRDHLGDLDDEVWLTDRELRELSGGISGMALWRWRHSERVGFPMPDAVIGGRNYTAVRTFRAWRAQRTTTAKRMNTTQDDELAAAVCQIMVKAGQMPIDPKDRLQLRCCRGAAPALRPDGLMTAGRQPPASGHPKLHETRRVRHPSTKPGRV
jgi:hypothetical protein